MKMGIYAQQRNFFELDDEFPEALKSTLDGYNKAAKRAAISAKFAARTGTLEAIRDAQWWETVTGTIESCLSAAIDDKVEFSIPTQPAFNVS